MLRGLGSMLAVGFTVAVVGLSMSNELRVGFSLGTDELNARLLGALSVAFDGLKALLPLFIAWQWSEGDWMRAACGSCLFALLVAYGAASAVGFARRTAAIWRTTGPLRRST